MATRNRSAHAAAIAAASVRNPVQPWGMPFPATRIVVSAMHGGPDTRVRHVGSWRNRGGRIIRPIAVQIAWLMEDYEFRPVMDWEGAPTVTVWEDANGRRWPSARSAAGLS